MVGEVLALQSALGKKQKANVAVQFKCLHAGLNHGPLVYKTNALPLSYKGKSLEINFNFQAYMYNTMFRIFAGFRPAALPHRSPWLRRPHARQPKRRAR